MKTYREAMAEAERAYVAALLAEYSDNVKRAADAADVTRGQFYRLMDRNGIKPHRKLRTMHPAWRAISQ